MGTIRGNNLLQEKLLQSDHIFVNKFISFGGKLLYKRSIFEPIFSLNRMMNITLNLSLIYIVFTVFVCKLSCQEPISLRCQCQCHWLQIHCIPFPNTHIFIKLIKIAWSKNYVKILGWITTKCKHVIIKKIVISNI